MSPVGLNERLARNRFTAPPKDNRAAGDRVEGSYRCTVSPKTAITDLMSALPTIADITGRQLNVRFVPKAAVSRCSKNPLPKVGLFDHLVGATKQRNWKSEP